VYRTSVGLDPAMTGNPWTDFKRPVCLVKGHDFRFDTRFLVINSAFVLCNRCGETHSLDDVTSEKELRTYTSKHVDGFLFTAPWVCVGMMIACLATVVVVLV